MTPRNRAMKLYSQLLFCLLLSTATMAQNFSNNGKEFWLPYAGHIDNTTSRMALYISSSENTSGEVQLDNKTIPFTVAANQATTVQISPVNYNVYNSQADGTGIGKGIRVISQKPIVLYAHILNAARSGSTLVLPVTVLGKEYVSLNAFQATNQGSSQITVVATEDNTTIELNLIRSSSGTPVRSANIPYQINLNKGDVYQVQSTLDLTGSTIKSIGTSSSSCKPIAVFTGSSWTAFDCAGASGGDNLYQQVFPSKAWGRNYITAPFANRQSDVYRVIVRDPSTKVTLNGSLLNPTSLVNSTYYEFKNSIPNVLEADKPILVLQYMTSQTCDTRNPGNCGNNCPYPGDPEMITINPLEQTINNVSVVSARSDLTPPNTNIRVHYLNVLMKTADIGSLKIDNALPKGSWIPIPNSIYSYLQEDVTASTNSNPSHNIKADSGFIALAYGMGNVESYGYNAGTNIIDLNAPVKVQNEFADASVNFSATCINSPFRLNLSLTYEPIQIVFDFLGTANLSSGNNKVTLSPTKPDSTYISNGKTYFYYKGPELYRFNSAGIFPVKITTTTNLPQSDGCSSTNEQEITDNVTVNEAPVAAVSLNYNGCRTDAISFTDQSDGKGRAIVRWLWNFSDGSTSTLQNPAKIFGSSGNFSAKLTAITDYGCIGEITKDISLSDKATPAFSLPDTTCAGNILIFKNLSSAPAGTTMSKWTWIIDTLATKINASNEDVVQQFLRTGKYQIKLMVETSTGCKSDTLAKELNVRPFPKVGLVLPDFCLAEGSARFSDTSKIADGTESDFKYEWKFNLTNTIPSPSISASTAKNPDVNYFNVGVYKTQLKIVSKFGCMDSLSGDFTVNGSRPKADFMVLRPDSICSNLNAKIIHKSTVDFGNITKTELIWDLADNAASRILDENPLNEKIYEKKYDNFQQPVFKNYQVKLVAYSGNASVCRDSMVKVIKINQSPKVSFSRIPGICLDAAPRQISQANELGNVAGSFTFSGRGISANGLFNPQLANTGTYTIQYLYQTPLGCTDSASMPITVWPSPIANFGISSPLCEKNNIQFSDSSKANYSKIVQWNWNFRDGDLRQRADGTPFNKRYDTAGVYLVVLRVTTDSGCVSPNDTMAVRVTHLPIVNFTLPGGICLPDGRGTFASISKIPDGSESLFSYRWNFGDPSDPTPGLLSQMTHRFSTLGTKNVQLKITTKDGCTDSLTRVMVNIYPQPKAQFVSSSTELCREGTIQFTDQSASASGAVSKWHWYLGSSDSSFVRNPSKQFNDSGKFTIRLFIYDDKGCVSDTSSQELTVHPYPVLQMTNNLRVLEGGTIKIKPYYFGSQLQFNWTPASYLDSADIGQPSSTPPDDITYRLTLTGIGGCSVSDTVFIKVLKSPLVPNAFSPNGDGINDTWRILYLESYPGATIEVFNRYGQKVFESTGYTTEWDGYFNGTLLPIGTYYYIINPRNGRKTITGAVTIIR